VLARAQSPRRFRLPVRDQDHTTPARGLAGLTRVTSRDLTRRRSVPGIGRRRDARRPDGELFTDERLAEFIEREAANGLLAPETLRGLRDAIIERGEGALRDDATALLLESRRDT
jgi:hypothetical protein